MVNWAEKVYRFFVGYHGVAEVGKGDLVHDVQDEALDWDVHILGEMHLVQLI